MSEALDLLLKRRSVKAKDLCENGPSNAELQSILQAAIRVPDHGKIAPWRIKVLQGESRCVVGAQISEHYKSLNPLAKEKHLENEASRFLRSPLVLVVSSEPNKAHKVPVWEQQLSAGAVCQNILLAATTLGYGAQWLTEWVAYDDACKKILNIPQNADIAGFIYVGSYEEAPMDRARPDIKDIVSYL